MFDFWCKNKMRKKRHLRVKYRTSHAKTTQLVSRNSDELAWLKDYIVVLAEQIEKLQQIDNAKDYFTSDTQKIYDYKQEIYDSKKRIEHLENVNPSSEQVIMDEKTFRKVITTFNIKMRDKLIQGDVVNLKNRMGFFYVQFIKRYNPKWQGRMKDKALRYINWGASVKNRQRMLNNGEKIRTKQNLDGKEWMVFYDDPYYIRYAWAKNKGACRVKNHKFYMFIPSRGKKGASRLLSEANMKDPMLYKNYMNRRFYYPRLGEKR